MSTKADHGPRFAEPPLGELTEYQKGVFEIIKRNFGANRFKPYDLPYDINRPVFVCRELCKRGYLVGEPDSIPMVPVYRLSPRALEAWPIELTREEAPEDDFTTIDASLVALRPKGILTFRAGLSAERRAEIEQMVARDIRESADQSEIVMIYGPRDRFAPKE